MSSKQHTRKREGPGRGCQVQGCTDDLSCSKEYHRKHKVCEKHSKFPKVIVRGLEQRFCQQCSRFHSLEEFDEGKRSCRKRLAGHNERRRKPPGASKASTSMLLASTFGNYQQNSLTGNGTAFICQGRLCGNAQNLKMINHEVPYWPSNVRIENQVTGFPDPKSIGYNRFNTLFCYNSGKSLPFLSSSRTKPDVYNMGNSAMDSPFRHFISFPSSKSDATSSSQGSSFVQDSPAIVDRSSALSLLSSPVWSSKFKESVPMHMKSSVYRLKELPKQDYQTSTALSFMETRNGVFNLEEKSLAVSSNLSEGLQSGNYTDNIYFMDEKQGAGCLLNLDEANVPGQGPLHMKMKDVQQVCSMTQKSYVHDLGNTGISGHGPHPSQYSF